MIHGDVHVRNVLVEKVNGKYRVWWIDFGLVKDACEEVVEFKRNYCINMFAKHLPEGFELP